MKDKVRTFIFKALVLSIILYFLWYLKIGSYYVYFIDSISVHFVSSFGIKIDTLWYPTAIFYNFIPFISLMLFTININLKKRILRFLIGLLILILSHILFSITLSILQPDYHVPLSALNYKLSVSLSLFSQILPFLLWVILAKRNLLSLFIPKRVYTVR